MVKDGQGSSNIQANNFGGLNKTSSSLNIPITDSPYLLNVDVDVSGKVKKRKGTRTIWKELTNQRMPLAEINGNLGYSFIISKLDDSLRVFEISNDEASQIWARPNVFRTQTDYVSFVSLPGDEVRVLILNNSQAPVQLRLHEKQLIAVSTGTIFSLGAPFTTLGISRVYKNEVPTTFTYDGSTLTIPGPVVVNDKIDIITFSWQWWAEAEYWFGDNFHRSLPRSGATIADQNVQIPTTLISNILKETEPNDYGIIAYATNAYNARYTYRSDGKPQTAFDYSFGDGSTYEYSATQSVTPSPFFLTFGKESGTNIVTITEANVTGTGFSIPGHNFNSYDIVVFKPDELITAPFVAGTPYYVKKISDNFFELYSDASLTTLVTPTPRVSLTFTDAEVDVERNLFNIPHPFPINSITPVVFENTQLFLPGGINPGQRYYMLAVSSTVLVPYFDKYATRRVDLLQRSERSFTDANVVVSPSDTITISNHLLFPTDRVRFFPYSGSIMPGGLTANVVYWVDVISPSAIQVCSDEALTTLVPITTTGTGTFIIRIDGGTMTMRVDGGRQIIERIPFNKVDIARLRRVPFNDDTGIQLSNLYVTVNNTIASVNTTGLGLLPKYSYETFNLNSTTPLSPGPTDIIRRIGFTGSSEIGIPRDSIVRIVNREPKWCGSAAINTPFNNDNGSWVPVFGLSKFANYKDGYFPGIGTVFQARLVLANFLNNPQTVLFSSRSATSTPEEFYQYFQITDANVTPEVDPFDILLPESSNYEITSLVEWQRSLYTFTENSVYRTFATDGIVTLANKVVGKVSEKGAVNSRSVAITESSILFVSDNGVYDLTPIFEQEYRAAEISIKVRSYFGVASVTKYKEFCWLAFDDVKLKLYLGLPKESDETESSVLLVFDTIQKSWTEYSSLYYFRTYAGLSYTDLVLGRHFMVSHKLPCFNAFTRFEYNKYADFIDVNFLSGGQNLITTTPVFWSGVTYDGVLKYQPDITVNFLRNVNDIRVFVGTTLSSLTELVFNQSFFKSNDGYIELLNNPGNGVIVVVPKIAGSFYGSVLFIDNIITMLSDNSFGGIDFSNACRCAFGSIDPSGGGGITFRTCEFVLQTGEEAEVGYPYLAIYTSPPLTEDLLSNFKRVIHLFVMFENVRSRFSAEDVNIITQQYSDLVNRAENDLGVNLAIIYQSDNEGVVAEDIYENPYVEKFDSQSVFKEPLQGIGYQYQLVVYSCDIDTWVMIGYQITGKVIGQRHISGDR